VIANNTSKRTPSFFLVIGLVGVFAVLTGFAKTFILPVSAGNFKAPPVIYIHGAFAFGWIILFVTQTFLIHFNNYRIHMTLGIVGIFIALGVALTMIPAGLYAVEKELKQGLGDTAISGIVGTCISALMFFSIVLAGIIYRNKPETHKRLMLLATILVLWPAWFRFRHYFPSIPRPDIWFAVVLADSLIVISWIRDKLVNGRIHPVLGYIGTIIMAEHIFEVIMFDSNSWRVVAKHIYGLISN
jgi:hypothetical protein